MAARSGRASHACGRAAADAREGGRHSARGWRTRERVAGAVCVCAAAWCEGARTSRMDLATHAIVVMKVRAPFLSSVNGAA
eukprot:5767260-Prymnesium_polylepis.1